MRFRHGLAINTENKCKIARKKTGASPNRLDSFGKLFFIIPIDESIDLSHSLVVEMEDVALNTPEERDVKGSSRLQPDAVPLNSSKLITDGHETVKRSGENGTNKASNQANAPGKVGGFNCLVPFVWRWSSVG